MTLDRRNFIQKIGMGSVSIGLLPAIPEHLTYDHTKPTENKKGIVVSETHAIADTTSGKVRGYTHGNIFTFKGIPYGANTNGEARFLPPTPPKPWQGIRDSLVYGPVCPQKPNKGWESEEYAFLFQWNDGYQSEDCLRLNVWSPGLKDNKKRPVMFWIHGGAFFSGSSQEHPSYDGENLSRKGDVVIVSVNHRLNVFGFLDLSDFGPQYEHSGNVGMLDLVAALEWVRDNIENFGGDPSNVTIFGQSGGAAKVTALMAMPSAKGLFHKAISHSSSTIRIATREYSSQLAKNVLEELEITPSDISKLHQIPFAKLVEAGVMAEKKLGGKVPPTVGRAGWQPVVEGKIFPSHPFDPVVPEFSSHIPMLIGSNRHEWSASIGNASLEDLDEEGLKQKLFEKYGAKSHDFYQVIRQVYSKEKPVEILAFLNPYNSMSYIQSQKKSQQKAAPVFQYMFAWNTPVMDGRPRAFHCSEIPFAFYNTDRCETMTGGGKEALAMAEIVSEAWINFARTGNPNHKGLPDWPPFTIEAPSMMIFNTKCEVKKDPDRKFREAYAQM